MIDKSFEKSLRSVEDLPSLPMVIQQIQRAMSDPDTSMDDISKIIGKDQTLAFRTMKLVNSAYYGQRSHITSIKQAIVVLGLNAVHNLMLGLSVIRAFKSNEKKAFDHQTFWEHALGCALISKGIARAKKYEEPEDCFIAGLLHDIGRIILEQYLHEDFIKALALSKEKNVSLTSQEKCVFGFNHADAGAFTALRWRIPSKIISAIRYHHSLDLIPDELSQYKTLVTIIAKANQICNKQGIGNSMENACEDDMSFSELGINEEDLESIVIPVKSEVKSTLREWQS